MSSPKKPAKLGSFNYFQSNKIGASLAAILETGGDVGAIYVSIGTKHLPLSEKRVTALKEAGVADASSDPEAYGYFVNRPAYEQISKISHLKFVDEIGVGVYKKGDQHE